MKTRIKQAALFCLLLFCMIAFFSLAVSAAEEVSSVQPGDLASALTSYQQAHPTAAQHKITANHRVVYAKDAYFKDMVNDTTSQFACYAKTGSDAIVTRLSQFGVRTQAVSDATSPSSFEILVGVVDRAAQKSFLPMVDVNEFGIIVTSNQIILLAWQDAALKVCVDTFVSYLSASTLSLPVGFCAVGVANDVWVTDFVRPTGNGIVLSTGQFVNDDSLQFLYTGTGVTQRAYLTYCTQLVSDGFSLVWENTIGQNKFRMYQNKARGIALYVAYNDFTYAAEFDALYETNYGTYDDGFAPEFEKCIRIISSPLSAQSVPPAVLNAGQPYQKITDTYMTTLGLASGATGTGYVIMLEDGRMIVIDGGNVSTKKNNSYIEAKAIWDTMRFLYRKAYGSNPTAQRPMHVAAWYLTHGHSDHYNAFMNMLGDTNFSKTLFKLDYVIANLPGEYSLFANTSTQWGYNNNANIHGIEKKVGAQYLKVHTGQRIYFANLAIEVLMTYEDHLPNPIVNTNDTNTVTRFHIGTVAKTGAVTSPAGRVTTVMILGDSWRPSGRYLCAMYGDYLKSDISQVAHHGNIGCEQELYEKIAPTGVLFSHDKDKFLDYCWGTTNSTNPETKHAYAVDQYVVRGTTLNGKRLTSVRYVWAAVANTTTTIQITAAGPQYESAFDLSSSRAIAYVDLNAAKGYQSGFAWHVHTFANTWKSDVAGHWKECACGDRSNVAPHTDAGGDSKCDVCSFLLVHVHVYGAWQRCDAAQHKRVCACNDVEYAPHNWNNGVVTTPPSHTTFGEKIYTCTDCGESYAEEIPKLTAHEYDAWQRYDAAQHKRVCACTDVEYAPHTWNNGVVTTPPSHTALGEKTFACTDCGETKTEDIPVLTDHAYGAWQRCDAAQHKRVCACTDVEYAPHNWNSGVVTTPPSHTTFGEKIYTCTDCGESYTEEIPKLTAHEYDAWQKHTATEHKRVCICGDTDYAAHVWNNGVVTTPPSHTALGEKTYTCTDCGESYAEDIPKLTDHAYGAWQKHTATEHKRVCICGDADYAAHVWNNGVVTTPPSHTALGEKTFTCTDCGETKTEDIPVLTDHAYGAWQRYDAAQHKRVCACTDVEYAPHNWNSGVVTTPPSHTTFGEKIYTCTDCGESYAEEIPKLTDHAYGAWQKHDTTQHKRVCACTDVEYAPHNWNSGVVTTPPSHTALGEKIYTCTDCGESYAEEIPKLTDHAYGAWQKHDAAQHKRACICGDIDYAAHNWNNGEVTTPPSHSALGKKTYTCTDCGETKTEDIPVLTDHAYGAWQKHTATEHKRVCICGDADYAAHVWNNGVVTTPPSHTALGEKTFTCTDCGETKTEDIPVLTDHAYGAWQKHDAAQHKRVCICGDIDYAAHNWNNGEVTTPPSHSALGEKTYTCTDCGETKTEDVPVLTAHEYDAWQKHDTTQHKRVCACTDVEYAPHTWNNGVVTTPPSHTALGEKTFTCTDCGETKTEDIPKLTAHEYGAWQKHTATEHKRVCACTDVEYAPHTWNNGVVTTPPSHTALGEKTFTCTDCGETKTEDIPVLTDHAYGAWQIVKEPEVGIAGKREKVCACGHRIEESIPALQEDPEDQTNPPSDGTPPTGEEKTLDTGIVLGVAVGALVLVGIGLLLWWMLRKKLFKI